MNMTRRGLLKAAPAAACLPILAAAGCELGTSPVIAVNLISGYVQAAVTGLKAIAADPNIQADLGSNASKVADAVDDAQNVLDDVKAAATSIATGTAQGWAQEIQADANIALPLVLAIPGLPASANEIVVAIQVVLPILLATVGSELAASARKAAPTSMTLDQAMAILKAPKV